MTEEISLKKFVIVVLGSLLESHNKFLASSIEKYIEWAENNEKAESVANVLFANREEISTQEVIKHMAEAVVRLQL